MSDKSKEVEKKLKVVHARVSEALENELKRRAGHLGVSVSNLVRNILKDTVGFVEEMMIDRRRGARGGDNGSPLTVLAWQEAVLNVNAVCGQCNALLPRGSHAALGVTQGAGPRPVLCTGCLTTLTDGDKDRDTSPLLG